MRARQVRPNECQRPNATAARWRGAFVAGMAAATLAACGGGGNDAATKACVDAIQAKLTGRNYELVAADLARSAKIAGEETQMHAQITFDKSLSSEYRQTVDCNVRVEAGKPPSVIFLQFNWSMDEVKKG